MIEEAAVAGRPLHGGRTGIGDPCRLPIAVVEEACNRALELVGVPAEHARQQTSLLMEAELRGHHSHGLLRLPLVVERIANGVSDPVTAGEHVWSGNTLQVDGRAGLGPVVASAALGKITARARTSGVTLAAIRNCNHLGMLAWYAEKIAVGGQVFIGLTISEALVHPWGGRKAMLGTNPIAIGVPADPTPFILDMATSAVSMGKIHDHANRREAIPPGWALDADGEPTTNAAAAKAGAIAPFGGAKGYALGLAFEVLVTSLTGASIGRSVTGTLDSGTVCNKGDVFIVAQPALGVGATVSEFLEELRCSPSADPDGHVSVPGDRATLAREIRKSGEIEIHSEVWQRIRTLADGEPLDKPTSETRHAV